MDERQWNGKDFYGVLGLDANATEDQIKKAYRSRALECHPDRHPPERAAEMTEKFKRVGEAFAVLSDSSLRRRYDFFRSSSSNPPPNSNSNPNPQWNQGPSSQHQSQSHYSASSSAGGEDFTFERAQEIFRNMFGEEDFKNSHETVVYYDHLGRECGGPSDCPVVGSSSSSASQTNTLGQTVTVTTTSLTRSDGSREERKVFRAASSPSPSPSPTQHHDHHYNHHNHHNHHHHHHQHQHQYQDQVSPFAPFPSPSPSPSPPLPQYTFKTPVPQARTWNIRARQELNNQFVTIIGYVPSTDRYVAQFQFPTPEIVAVKRSSIVLPIMSNVIAGGYPAQVLHFDQGTGVYFVRYRNGAQSNVPASDVAIDLTAY